MQSSRTATPERGTLRRSASTGRSHSSAAAPWRRATSRCASCASSSRGARPRRVLQLFTSAARAFWTRTVTRGSPAWDATGAPDGSNHRLWGVTIGNLRKGPPPFTRAKQPTPEERCARPWSRTGSRMRVAAGSMVANTSTTAGRISPSSSSRMRLLPPKDNGSEALEAHRPRSAARGAGVRIEPKTLTFAAGVGFRVALLHAVTRRPVLCATLVGVREDGDYDCHIDNADEDEDGREQAVCDLEPATRGASREAAATFSYSPGRGAAVTARREAHRCRRRLARWCRALAAGCATRRRGGAMGGRPERAEGGAVAHCSAGMRPRASRTAKCCAPTPSGSSTRSPVTCTSRRRCRRQGVRARHRLDSEAARAVAADRQELGCARRRGWSGQTAREADRRPRARESDATPVLLLGPSRAGKTWACAQLTRGLAEAARTDGGREATPVLISVQQLARALRSTSARRPATS